jgi:hypothetical protein
MFLRSEVIGVTQLELSVTVHVRVGIADEVPRDHNKRTTASTLTFSYLPLFKSCTSRDPQALDHLLKVSISICPPNSKGEVTTSTHHPKGARVAISYELPRHPSSLPQAPQLHPTFLPETPTFLKVFIKSDMSLLALSSRTFQRRFRTIPTIVTGARIRTMASTAAADKFEWLVILPDQPGKLEKRVEVRP